MPRYLLKHPWILRGFFNAPYVVLDPTGQHKNPVRALNQRLFDVLLYSDGQKDLEITPAVKVLLDAGLIVPAIPGERLEPEQRYRVLPFTRKPLVQLSITGRCNLNCLHCFMASDKERGQENDDLTESQLMSVLDQLIGCGVSRVEITGGEPLIHPSFARVVAGISARHLKLERILTNGFLLDDALLDMLEAQGQHPQIVISFDGLGVHNWLRNHPQAQERAIAAMDLTVKRNFPLRCSVNINRATLPGLLDTCRFLKSKGASSLYLIRTSETPRWSANTWVDESLPFEDYYEGCYQVAKADIEEDWRVDIHTFNGFFLTFDPEPRLSTHPPCTQEDSCAIRCGRASKSFFISHSGQVWPCDAFEGIGLASGFMDKRSLKDSTLVELLGNSMYSQAMNVTLGQIRSDNESCAVCSHFVQCGGGCRAFGFGWALHEKGYTGTSRFTSRALTNCTYYRGGYADKMAALVDKASQRYQYTKERSTSL